MSNGELSPQAKEAIRSYMIKIVTIPGVLLAILGFLIGFFLNDVAKASAYNKAYEKASQLILNLTKETSTAALESQKIQKDAEQVLKKLEDLKTDAERLKAKLLTAKAFQRSEGMVKEIVNTLLARDDFKHLITETVGGIHLFPSDKYIPLWQSKDGGPYVNDIISKYDVPKTAKGVLLKVVVLSNKSESGSFVCADEYGRFSPKASEIWHHQQNGFSNYLKTWVGGVVFCPLTKDGKIKWQMMSNENLTAPTKNVRSWGTLIGWFK
jgi:hypothetical protein